MAGLHQDKDTAAALAEMADAEVMREARRYASGLSLAIAEMTKRRYIVRAEVKSEPAPRFGLRLHKVSIVNAWRVTEELLL